MPRRITDPAAMSADMFRAHQSTLGLGNAELAAGLRVCLSAVEKYRSGARPIPGPVAALVEAMLRERRRGQD